MLGCDNGADSSEDSECAEEGEIATDARAMEYFSLLLCTRDLQRRKSNVLHVGGLFPSMLQREREKKSSTAIRESTRDFSDSNL